VDRAVTLLNVQRPAERLAEQRNRGHLAHADLQARVVLAALPLDADVALAVNNAGEVGEAHVAVIQPGRYHARAFVSTRCHGPVVSR
jgi:hypothetical protein